MGECGYETTIVYWDDIGTMENQMETTIMGYETTIVCARERLG